MSTTFTCTCFAAVLAADKLVIEAVDAYLADRGTFAGITAARIARGEAARNALAALGERPAERSPNLDAWRAHLHHHTAEGLASLTRARAAVQRAEAARAQRGDA